VKANLKNRPRTLREASPIGDKNVFDYMLKRHREFANWFETFEKTLQDLIIQLEDMNVHTHTEKMLIELHKDDLQAVFDAGYCRGQYELAKEITGQEE